MFFPLTMCLVTPLLRSVSTQFVGLVQSVPFLPVHWRGRCLCSHRIEGNNSVGALRVLEGQKDATICKPLIFPNTQQTHMLQENYVMGYGVCSSTPDSLRSILILKRHHLERFQRAASFPASADSHQP